MNLSVPLIDVRNNGLGDVVVACWILRSAREAGERVRLNARSRREVAVLLGIEGRELTTDESADWCLTPGSGEFALQASLRMSVFDAWCHTLNLPRLAPVRPTYCELSQDGEWADEQWSTVDAEGDKPRILIFPDAAWPIRAWPKAYYMDLATALRDAGYAVAAMAASQASVAYMPCHWWGGFSERQAAAMARRAVLVVANESGPAHLAAAVGTRTLSICGPTDPRIIFAHESNVQTAALDAGTLACVGCHFSPERGYRRACEGGECQALMRLDPFTVTKRIVATVSARRRVSEVVQVT